MLWLLWPICHEFIKTQTCLSYRKYHFVEWAPECVLAWLFSFKWCYIICLGLLLCSNSADGKRKRGGKRDGGARRKERNSPFLLLIIQRCCENRQTALLEHWEVSKSPMWGTSQSCVPQAWPISLWDSTVPGMLRSSYYKCPPSASPTFKFSKKDLFKECQDILIGKMKLKETSHSVTNGLIHLIIPQTYMKKLQCAKNSARLWEC